MNNKMLGLVGMVGLTGLLASCNVTVTPGGTTDNLQLSNVSEFSSVYSLRSAQTDQTGASYAAGTYVICDNIDTDITVGYRWTGGIKKVAFQLVGYNNGGNSDTYSYTYTLTDFSGSDSLTGTIGAGLAPLKIHDGLKRQAIIVNPVFVVKGKSYVRVQGVDSYGNKSNVVESPTVILIADCK
ncbi:hypothetical protein [Deinococcus sp.]|uniref:hypothetical protein n=1 Tax=Deinococcus sp. TaxID=47478 RepID=UPI0025F44011|nr:hypothetical protein [Deinococcus sp.]